ncbi:MULTISPECIES: isochorismatase family protein [Pseudoxanthomonas]|uniref:Nicotinamidase-related amidase n=1 Tax=Pseudoxanthomonas winnipegensis TaxID=2480810 RepID=A0AAW8GAQ2_9GAMM|nr:MULTISPECIES: isochorismatase family protein [Pseudoxanthomonas]MDQ1119432.1 nicotinamidase-related amidase [Pseudoxanthomonas winnipegensis]MDQ1132626.1 nicotinamidase-related amidase [Pseudoxanthomonas winnipegensis]MDR6137366.1 nicotinamidase-related amidase [Pseudoxanthomonas sp. SORGH_AS_0997]
MSVFADPNDAALLLVDHQAGLFQTVADIDLYRLRANVAALRDAAKLLAMPIITTASVPEGPNGPLVAETAKIEGATFVPRNGEVNAWDTPAFRQTVANTGRKTLVIAGVWTSVCVTFPALSALAEGYKVYAVIDASGDVSPQVAQIATMRMAQAGVTITTTNSLIAELQRTWQRNDATQYGALYASTTPPYATAMESFSAAHKA